MQLHGASESGEPTNLVVQLARFSARKHVQRARSLCGNTAVMYVLVVRVYAYVRVGAMGCHLSKVVTIAHLEMLTKVTSNLP